MAEKEKPIKAVLSWVLDGERELLLHEGDTAEVGRTEDNNMILPDSQVSRKHAVITWRRNHFEVKDVGSVNGTFVNGKLIKKPQALKDGDELRFHEVAVLFKEYRKPKALPKKEGVQQTIIVKPSSMQPSLFISAGVGEGTKIALNRGVMIVGRSTAANQDWDIPLQDRAVSRPQARFEMNDKGVILSDLSSANGTLLNGQLVSKPQTLKDGDVIIFGETTLIFRAV